VGRPSRAAAFFFNADRVGPNPRVARRTNAQIVADVSVLRPGATPPTVAVVNSV
jgi:hypothetical protein